MTGEIHKRSDGLWWVWNVREARWLGPFATEQIARNQRMAGPCAAANKNP